MRLRPASGIHPERAGRGAAVGARHRRAAKSHTHQLTPGKPALETRNSQAIRPLSGRRRPPRPRPGGATAVRPPPCQARPGLPAPFPPRCTNARHPSVTMMMPSARTTGSRTRGHRHGHRLGSHPAQPPGTADPGALSRGHGPAGRGPAGRRPLGSALVGLPRPAGFPTRAPGAADTVAGDHRRPRPPDAGHSAGPWPDGALGLGLSPRGPCRQPTGAPGSGPCGWP